VKEVKTKEEVKEEIKTVDLDLNVEDNMDEKLLR